MSAIAFYNFENLFDTLDEPYKFDEEFTPDGAYHYTTQIYNQKLHNLSTVLIKLGTDVTPDGPAIIGTAEVENDRVLTDLCAQPELEKRKYKFVHIEGPDTRGIDCALLYNPKYFTVIQAESLNVDISKDGDGKGGKTRDVLHVTGVLAGDTTHVFVNHWPSRRGGEAASAPLRAIAAGVCRDKIKEIEKEKPNAKIIVMGDLNDDPINASVAKVLNAQGNREKVKGNGLYNPWVAFYNAGIGTLGYNDAWNLFDQIMISGSWLSTKTEGWRYYKSEVFNKDFLKEHFGQYKNYPHRSFGGTTWLNGYSDHFPTIIYIIKPIAG